MPRSGLNWVWADMRVVLVFVGLFVLAGFLFVRFAPTDIAEVHQPAVLEEPGNYPSRGGFVAVRKITTTPDRLLHVLDDIVRQTPRTDLIAGDFADEMMTYQTRSSWVGFPDYTTVQIVKPEGSDDALLVINGRLRFGHSDLGANQARIERWLEELGLLIIKA